MKFIIETWASWPFYTREIVWFNGVEWMKTTSKRYYKGSEWYVETNPITLLEACRWLKKNKKGGYKSKAA